MSPRTENVEAMPEKKPKLGRPKTLPKELDTRFQIRCSTKDVEAWKANALRLGFRDVSAWIRKAANDALNKQASK